MSNLPVYWSKMETYFTVFGLDCTKIKCLSVLGDGNCLYRALALLYFGNENAHVIVRAVICFLGLEHTFELEYEFVFLFFSSFLLGFGVGLNFYKKNKESIFTQKIPLFTF